MGLLPQMAGFSTELKYAQRPGLRRMRRLVIELYGRELEKRIENSSFDLIKSLELVHILRHDQTEHAGIWRVQMKDSSSTVEDCFKGDGFTKEIQVLDRVTEGSKEEGGDFLVFLRRKVRPGLLLGSGSKPGSGFMDGLMQFKDGRLRFSYVGTQSQIRAILQGAEERGLRYKVVSMGDADFAEDSLLNRLTEKQRGILLLAYKLGYFDVPKRINSDELGARLHLSGSTVVEHLSKAENRLLTGIIEDL